MEPLASQLPIYTSTARAIAPQNRFIAPESSQSSADNQNTNRTTDPLRGAGYANGQLNRSLGSASELIGQASSDLSRIGDALDEIDALVTVAEENTDLSTQQRAQLNAQIEDYLTQIDDIAANSNFEGRDLLASDQTITLQVGTGTTSDNRIDVALSASSSEDLATGLSAINVSDSTGVSNARALVDEAQQALRDREVSLASDQGSLHTAQDQNRVSQVAGENIVQAQLAASETSGREDAQARISQNLQAYLGDVSAQLANQTVAVGGISLPEPRPEPVPEQEENPFFDPTAEEDDPTQAQDLLGQSVPGSGAAQPFTPPAFGGYDSGGNGTSGGSGTADRPANRVSVEA
jgi:flagellin